MICCDDRTVLDTIWSWFQSNDTEVPSGQIFLLRMRDCIRKSKTKKSILKMEHWHLRETILKTLVVGLEKLFLLTHILLNSLLCCLRLVDCFLK
jgi:hypothetical protein